MNDNAKRDAIARIIFFGEPDLVDTAVYELSSPAPHLIAVRIAVRGVMTDIVIADSHVVAVIGNDRRSTASRAADARVFMDRASTRIISDTLRLQPNLSALSAMMVEDGVNVRCLIGLGCLRQIQPDDGVTLPKQFFVDGELWPELRHNAT